MARRIRDGTSFMAGRRMHHHASRLIDDRDRCVFEDDVERDRFGLDRERWSLRHHEREPLPKMDSGANTRGGLVIDNEPPILDQSGRP